MAPLFGRVGDWVSVAVVGSSAFTSLVFAISRCSSTSDGYEVVSGHLSSSRMQICRANRILALGLSGIDEE